MTKYSRSLTFGFCLLPTAEEPKRPLELAEMAGELGLDYIGIQEEASSDGRFDSWTLLTAIGAATSCITLIAPYEHRPQNDLVSFARAASSLDLLTQGRVTVAFGEHPIPGASAAVSSQPASDGAVASLEEALQVLRLMWSGQESVDFAGKVYSLSGVEAGPAPAKPISIWISDPGPAALAVVGRLADGWIAGVASHIKSEELAEFNRQLDEAASAANRDPGDIQRILLLSGTIGSENSNGPWHGNVRQWAEQLVQLAVDGGVDTFLLLEGENGKAQLELFAKEVVPLTRELIALVPGLVIKSGIARARQGAAASGATISEEATDNPDLVDETSMESFPASDPPASSSFN